MGSKCKKNYILNPNTNRCILKNGATAKKIGKSSSKPKPKSKPKKSPPKFKKKSPTKPKSPPKPKEPPKPKKSPKQPKSPKSPLSPKVKTINSIKAKNNFFEYEDETGTKVKYYYDENDFRFSNPNQKDDNDCYKFNGVKICEHFKSRYFEEQKDALCGLHALNNLLQNQFVIPYPNLFTKQQLDDECKLFYKERANKRCYADGWYSTEILENIIKKNLPQLDTTVFVGKDGFNHAINEITNNNNVLGAIVLYKAPKCGNHFVSLIPYNNKFLVIDSAFKSRLGHRDLQVVDTKLEIKKYFYFFLETLLVYKKPN